MSVEGVEVVRQSLHQRSQPADGIEREKQHCNSRHKEDRALDHVRHQNTPKPARERIGEHNHHAKPDAGGKRNLQKHACYQPERVEPHHVVEDAERDAAPADDLSHARTVALL